MPAVTPPPTQGVLIIMGRSYWTISVADADDTVEHNGNRDPNGEPGKFRTRAFLSKSSYLSRVQCIRITFTS